MKTKIKTISFWTGLAGSLLMIVDAICGFFGIDNVSDALSDVLFSIFTMLIVLGVINKKTESDKEQFSTEELLEEIKEQKDDN